MSHLEGASSWSYFRVVIAFLVSPLVVPIILGLLADNIEPPSVEKVIKYLPLFSFLTYLVAAVIGGPVYLVFRELKIQSMWAYSLAGLAIGLLVFLLVQVFIYAWHADMGLGVAFTFSRTLATTVFWIIAKWTPRSRPIRFI